MSRRLRVPLKVLDLLIIFMMVFSAPVGVLAAPSPTGATIASDQADYPPGAPVTLTGSGWSPNESVNIVVNDTLGQTWKHDVIVQADGSGNLTDVFTLPNTFISDYDVTASGPTSGSATTTFTDASGNLWQCANGGVGQTPDQCRGSQLGAISGDKNYENGNENGQKSHWREGEFIAYRETLTLDSGGNYVFTLGYDTVTNNKHAIDYIGSFDFTETTGAATTDHANQNNPCGDVIAGCDPANPNSSFAIPAASFPNSNFCGGASNGPIPQIPGKIKIWGANNPVISNVSYAFQYVGSSCETAVNVTFSTTAGGNVVIAWGGHIASQNDWGVGNSASFINGSPFHTR